MLADPGDNFRVVFAEVVPDSEKEDVRIVGHWVTAFLKVLTVRLRYIPKPEYTVGLLS